MFQSFVDEIYLLIGVKAFKFNILKFQLNERNFLKISKLKVIWLVLDSFFFFEFSKTTLILKEK